LGLILHVSPNHNIIAKVESTPRIGEIVVDENLKPIGKIADLLGPVSSPYAAIRPTIQDTEKLVNKTVYMLPFKRRKEKNAYGR
jgi:rRNA processing protein Gar1